jgi:hypothetical protein
MGQQPNIELEISDLPRPTATPPAARRWKPSRPGDATSPGDVPWGGAFGTPGPDTGFVLRLIKRRDFVLRPHESRKDAEAVLGALAAARASHVGRAPTSEDVDVALLLLGFDGRDVSGAVIEALGADREEWIAGAAHDGSRVRAVTTAVDRAVLAASPAVIRERMAAGERLVER